MSIMQLVYYIRNEKEKEVPAVCVSNGFGSTQMSHKYQGQSWKKNSVACWKCLCDLCAKQMIQLRLKGTLVHACSQLFIRTVFVSQKKPVWEWSTTRNMINEVWCLQTPYLIMCFLTDVSREQQVPVESNLFFLWTRQMDMTEILNS